MLIRQHYLLMMHEARRWSHCTARMLAARIARDTKMRPAKRRAQFDTTISPIIDPEHAVKQIYCAILCDPVRIWCLSPGDAVKCKTGCCLISPSSKGNLPGLSEFKQIDSTSFLPQLLQSAYDAGDSLG